jgi:dCMP deaminase
MADAASIALSSDDPRTNVGCVLVHPDHGVLARAANRLPPGISAIDETRRQTPSKYLWVEHAERAALFQAARLGVSTVGTTMYVHGGFPCAECARAIVAAGVATLVYYIGISDTAHWEESYRVSRAMMREAGIAIFGTTADGNTVPE